MTLGTKADKIFRSRYAFKEDEDWQGLAERVGRGGASVEDGQRSKYEEIFSQMIHDMLFLPGGRILRNIGRPRGTLFNCYVEPLEDSIEEIGQFQMNCGILWSEGGGVGCNASFLRPEDAPIIQKGGESSGPLSFLKWANAGANCIKTGGARRAAMLALMLVSHPDIFKFINAKLVEGELNCFNISVGVMEDFLDAVEANDEWNLKWHHRVWRTVHAREIWDLILENMVKVAEPGLINWDNLRSNNSYYFDPIISTNPCFSNDTKVLTKQGHFEIRDLVDKEVDVWDGSKWITIDNFRITGENQKMLKITLYDGSELRVTPYHKFYLEGYQNPKEARQLREGDKLVFSNAPLVHGNMKEKGAYIKGFLLGDGSIKREDEPVLRLYEPKYCCEDDLIKSANEVPVEEINTNAIEELEFNYEEGNNRKNLTGLTIRKNNLHKWCNEYKNKLPKEIFQWDLKSKCEFLAGYFDADGTTRDSKTSGFGYQLWANSKEMLLDVQLLLKTIGVQSKLSLGKEECKKDFNDGYGEYNCKKSHRINISQRYSIELSKMVKFKRLKDFSDRKMKRLVKEKYNMIVSIEEDGIDEKVYCCTVPTTNSFALSNWIYSQNCGEVPLGAHGVCCLGSLVLPKFISTKNTNWKLMQETVYNAVRFLDNVIQVNRYPLTIPEIQRKAFDGRRIGLGFMGLGDYLFAKKVRYGSQEAIDEIEKLVKNIRNYAYEASIRIADEKGAFPKFDTKMFSKANFIRSLPASTRMDIKKYGVRNVSLLAVAPTGCQDKDTMIITNKGILTLAEIGDINGEEWQDINLKVSQEKFQEERNATKFYINGKSNTKKIYLKSGNTLESTYNHQYRILENGNYIWKRADELNIGDDIVSVLDTYNKISNPDLYTVEITHGNQKNINPIFSMNKKLAEFLGIYFSDDGSNHSKGIKINCNTNNEEEYIYVAKLGEEIFGISPTFSDRNCMSVCFNSQQILNFFELNGLLKQKSNEISIPNIIRTSSKSCIKAFIKGLIFADGSRSGNNIYLDTASEKLSKELLVVIRAIGNDVRIQKHTSGLGSEMFRVWIKNGVYKFRPFHEQKKKEQLEFLNLDTCIVDEIIKIENSENYTYDIEVPNTVTYIANSVISHNTISLLPEVTSSAEPLVFKAFKRHDEIGDRIYVHPIYQDIIKNNEATPDWFVDTTDLTPQDHFETQVIIQKYTDGAISKTINTPKGFKAEQLSHLLLEYIRDLKGVTLYVDGSREEQILVPIKSKKEVKKYIDEGKVHTDADELSCGTGTCEI